MKEIFLTVVVLLVIVKLISLTREVSKPTEKVDYTISISNGIVTVRNVDNNEVIGRNVLDSLSVIIINDNK